ncbi:MAG: pyridoxamine 5'-phosphate oxidase [Saprospiraceae bacterium]|nr:pyridoxamine 5'-phosphate oxidase [Saprospiraceae bacterium]
MQHISDLRKAYQKFQLSENSISADPLQQFDIWFKQALEVNVSEANAFVLSTVNTFNKPNSRVVLLKALAQGGFVFYTNYKSTKAKEMAHSPYVSMCFLWHELERQIRISGIVNRVTREESELYFNSRPRESQLGAWVSPQSDIISSRDIIDNNMTELVLKYKNIEKIPLPDHWGGYRVIPDEIEFWQGRPNRLHDRIRYTKINQEWKKDRLAP